jgi:hypothetical protein
VDVSRQVPPPDRHRAAIDATAAGLREIAGPQLYRSNAFRIAGLPTDADRKTVRQRQRQVIPALEAGADVDLGHRLPVRLTEVRAAFDRLLNDPHRRLVDELFWLWGPSNADCGCITSLHEYHDTAVHAHSAALDLNAKGENLTSTELDEAERLWSTAGEMWGKVLRRAAFWDHVRARITALDERQLDESVIDVLRDQVPLTLLKPLIELAAETSGRAGSWLAEQARHWPAVPRHVIDEQLEQAAAPFYDAARNATKKAATTLDEGQPAQAASAVYQEVMPQLRRLEELVPHHGHRRTARARDAAALVLNNCATVLIDRIGPLAKQQADEWLGTARDLASDSQALHTIDANKATLDDIVTTFEKQVSDLVGRQSRAGGLTTANRPTAGQAAGNPESSAGCGCTLLVLLVAAIAAVIYFLSSGSANSAPSFSERIDDKPPLSQPHGRPDIQRKDPVMQLRDSRAMTPEVWV